MEGVPGNRAGGTQSGSQVGQAAEQAKQQGQQLAQRARQQASELANRGNEQVKGQLANQKHEAAQRLTPIKTAVQETAHQLRRQGQGSVAEYADKAADQVERFSGYLRETDVDEILEEARSFARQRPALFVGSAVALGFFATRFLKSSSQEAAASVGYAPRDTPSPPGGEQPSREEPPPGEERPERRAAVPTTPPTAREEPPPGEERPGRRTP